MLADIVTIVNYSLIGVIVFIVVALLYFFFRGLTRGWRYGTYRIAMFAILFIVCFATLRSLANVLGNLDLRSFAIPDFNISIPNGDDTIILSAHVTTAFETGSSLIEQLLKAYNVNADPERLSQYSMALTQSLLAMVLMIVESLVIVTLGNLLIMVIWHLVVKRFIKKEKRKEKLKKGRLISGLEELLIGAVCLCMLIAPLSAMVNSASASWKSAKEEDTKTQKRIEADNSTYQLINDVLDTYDNSVFSQVFFSWSKNEKGQTYDVALMDYLTTINLGTSSISFLNELSALTKSASYAVQGGILSEQGFQKQNVGAFISSEFAPELVRSLGASSLVTTIFPYAVAVASNIDSIAKYVKTDAGLDIDYTYDYAKTFDDLADLYEVVVDSGIVNEILNEDLSLKDPDDFLTQEFVEDNRGILETILSSLDDDSMHLFDSIVESAIFVRCAEEAEEEAADPDAYKTKLMLKDFLPDFESADEDGNGFPDKVPASYKSIKWGDELANIVDPILDLMTIDPDVISIVLNTIDGGELDYADLIEITVDNYDAVFSVVCGAESSSDVDVKLTRKSDKGLLQSPFVERAMNKLLAILSDQLNSMLKLDVEFAIDLSDVMEQLSDEDMDVQITNVTNEIRRMFDVVTEFINSEAGSEFLKNLDTMPGVYFDKEGKFLGVDDDLLSSLSSALVKLDDSLIIQEVMPKALGGFLSGDDSPLKSMNLGDIHLDFNVDDIGEELSELVIQFSKCQDLISYIMTIGTISTDDVASASNVLSGLAKYSDQLLDFLLFVADSKIINPTVDGKQNYNIAEMLKTLLSSVFEDSANTIESVVFSSDFDIDSELESVVNLLVDFDKYNVVELALGIDADNLDLSAFSSIDFVDLFSNIDGSKLMSSLVGDYLDELLFNDGGAMHVDGADVSFKNVTSWSYEGGTINTLVKAAAEIGDLKNIDFFNSDPYAVESIITALSQSSLFESKDGYQFSNYIAGLLVLNIENAGSDVAKIFADSDGVSYSNLEYSIKSVSKEEWEDEAHSLSQILRYLSPCKIVISDSNINLKEVNLNAIGSLLECVTDSKAFGMVVVPNFYNTIIDTLTGKGMDAFENANTDFIYTADSDDVHYENHQLIKILEAAMDPVYGVIEDDGSVKKVSVNNIDSYYFANPLLKALADSHVFNSLSDKQISDGVAMTALEKEFSTLLGSSSLFESQNKADKAVLSVTKGVTDFAKRVDLWNDEIDHVTNVLTSLQELDIDLNDFSFEDFFPNGKDEAKRQQLENVLDGINESQILHSVLPYQIDKSVDLLSEKLGSYTIENVNAYYTGLDEDGLANKYDEDEIETLSYIIQDGLTMGELDMASLHGEKVDSLMDLMKRLSSSNVFNTISDSTSEYDMTAFENVYYQALNKAGVYKDSNQLKASVYQVTDGMRSDLSILGKRGDMWEEEINLLHQTFIDLDEIGFDLNDFDYDALDESQEEQLADILNDVDKTTTLHAILPLEIEEAVGKVDDALGEGVSIGTVNSRYNGTSTLYYGDGLSVSVPNRYNDETECERIARIAIRGIHIGSVDLSKGKTDTKFVALLTDMGYSNIFNTLPEKNYGVELTSLETVYSTSLKKSDIYESKVAEAASLMVTNGESDLTKRGEAWEEELAHVSDVVDASGNIDININDFNLKDLFNGGSGDEANRQAFVILLNRLSDSSTLHSVVPLKMRTSITSYKSSLNSNVISFDNANYDYAGKTTYTFLDTEKGSVSLPNAYEYEENETLSYIIMEASTLPNEDISDLTAIDTTPYISLMKRLSSSHVFNTLEEGLVHSTDVLTSFENTYVSILDEGDVYEDYGANELIVCKTMTFDATKGITDFDRIKSVWDGEIGTLDQIFADYKKCGFTMQTINLSNLFPMSDSEDEAEANRVDFKELLDDLNSSLTMHSTIHNTVEEAIAKISTRLGGDSMDNANVFYTGYSNATYKLGYMYTDDEIEMLSHIVKDSMRMPTINKDDLSTVDASKVTNILAELAKSQIFNSLKDGEDFTAFDTSYAMLMTTKGISDLYYYQNNPLDEAASYTTSSEKAKVAAKNTWKPLDLETDIDAYDVSSINGDTNSLKYVFSYFVDPANSGVINSLNGNTSSLDGDVIYEALSRLNSCSLTCDMVPNVIDKTLNSSSFSLGSINIKRANPFYCYNGSWGNKYDDDEIESIASIITHNNNMKDSGGNSILSSLDSATFTSATVSELKSLLTSMNESKVFHLAGARSGAEYYDASVDSWKESWTVFEQVLGTIYDKSGLASLSFDSTRDTSFSSYSEKLAQRMDEFRNGTLDSLHGSDADRYQTEIDSLCNTLGIAIDKNLVSSGLNLGSFSLDTLSPDDIKFISYALNYMDIVCDALPNKISAFISSTGLDKYSEVNVNGTKDNVANFYVGQQAMKDGAIDSMYVLAKAVYEADHYVILDGTGSVNMSEWILKDGKFSSVLEFINEPNGFYAGEKYSGTSSTATYLDTLSKETGTSYDFTARDVFFYNVSNFDINGTIANFGTYLGDGDSLIEDLKGSRMTFDKISRTTIAYSTEESALRSTIVNLGTVYAGLSSVSSSTTIPTHLADFESLSNSLIISSVESLFDHSIAYDGYISERYASGLLEEPLYRAKAYINGSTYYTAIFDSTLGSAGCPYPSSYYDGSSVRVRSTYDSNSVLTNYSFFDSDDISNNDVKNAYLSMLAVTQEIGINSTLSSHTVDSSKLSNAFATIDALASNSRVSALTKLFYLSSTYDYLLNRGTFHGSCLSSAECDVPNPFDSSFTYSGLSSFIA